MKNYFKNIRSTFIWSVLLLFSFNLLAQGSATGYLYVYPSDPSAYPDQQGGVSNPTLQDFFLVYQVVSYHKSFPGAASQMLQNAYEIHCDGDVDELKAKLESTGLFSLIEIESYMQTASMPIVDCPEPCTNPQSVNDPNSGYELTLPGYLCAWNITQGDPSVVVAVIDTDFDLDDPELAGKVISKVGTPGSPNCSHHGNIVAGTIVATPNNGIEVAGVAPGARVAGYVVNTTFNSYIDANGNLVCSCSGSPWGQTWQAYLDGRKIINVSWSGLGNSSTVVNAIKEITGGGTLLIVAAGNGDPGSQEHSAYYNIPGVLNVSSISSDGTLHQWVSYNQGVDLCAPGNAVSTLTHDYCGGTRSIAWGTSLSAPNAAGAAALILSVNPCLKPTEIENILKTTTCPIENPTVIDIFTNISHDDYTGTGYLNAYAAVLKAQGYFGSISVSDTWTGENYVSADVVVETNVTLTINGTVKFSEGASLIIKPGGRVNLYGTLTNSCMGPWDGVVVEGIATESQYTAGKHGRLYTYEGAVIENAVTGVKLIGGGILYGIMQGESAGNLPQNKAEQLLNYANNGTGYSAAWAKNILTVKGYHFPPKPKHPAGSEERNSEQKNKLTAPKSPYVISPNPANDYVYFTCTNSLRSANPIIVTDATGRVIWQSLANQESPTTVWGTTTIRPGVYFYSIYDEAGLIQSGRIAILK